MDHASIHTNCPQKCVACDIILFGGDGNILVHPGPISLLICVHTEDALVQEEYLFTAVHAWPYIRSNTINPLFDLLLFPSCNDLPYYDRFLFDPFSAIIIPQSLPGYMNLGELPMKHDRTLTQAVPYPWRQYIFFGEKIYHLLGDLLSFPPRFFRIFLRNLSFGHSPRL